VCVQEGALTSAKGEPALRIRRTPANDYHPYKRGWPMCRFFCTFARAYASWSCATGFVGRSVRSCCVRLLRSVRLGARGHEKEVPRGVTW